MFGVRRASSLAVVEDFTHTLREALAEVEAAGFAGAAAETRRRCFSAYATSSEWLGEVAVADLSRAHGPSLPLRSKES
jgi:hypothetical protein